MLDLNKKLPQNMVIECNHLYRIGLINRSVSLKENKRPIIYNFKIIIIVLLIYLIKNILCFGFSEQNIKIFVFFGDFSYFIPGMRFQFYLMIILIISLSLISLLSHKYIRY